MYRINLKMLSTIMLFTYSFGAISNTSHIHHISYYTAQLIILTTATELQQLLSAVLHTGNHYSVGCCRGRVLFWECET